VNIGIGLVAAMLVGVGLVLQQHAAEQAPKAYFLQLRLITELLRQRRWLVGIAIMVAGQILSAWTIGHLSLSLAEPLLATELIFALIVAVPLSRERLQKSEMIGAVLLSAGVAALSVSRSINTQGLRFGSAAYWPAAAAIGAIALCLIRAGWRREGQQRALLTGTASGLIFGISDALTRQTVEIISRHSLVAVLTSWPAYCLVATSLVALWLMESSFNAAPLHASLPAITAAEPVAGILLGVVVFGDVIHISPGLIALQAVGLVALVTGVILVARAPALSSLRPKRLLPVRPARAKPAQPASQVGAAQPASQVEPTQAARQSEPVKAAPAVEPARSALAVERARSALVVEPARAGLAVQPAQPAPEGEKV
jgi:drug/metabolite transporter (DMT)-like permease